MLIPSSHACQDLPINILYAFLVSPAQYTEVKETNRHSTQHSTRQKTSAGNRSSNVIHGMASPGLLPSLWHRNACVGYLGAKEWEEEEVKNCRSAKRTPRHFALQVGAGDSYTPRGIPGKHIPILRVKVRVPGYHNLCTSGCVYVFKPKYIQRRIYYFQFL
jgi:hypothetical protein